MLLLTVSGWVHDERQDGLSALPAINVRKIRAEYTVYVSRWSN
jgi:hypothetical protein